MSKGRLEAKITVPAGGWTGTIDDSGGGGAAAWTVAAGEYYLTSLLTAFAAALNVAATTDTLTVTASLGEDGTGKVSVTSTGNGTLVWTSTDLRDLLGYSANLTLVANTANTAAAQARSLWIADCPYDAPNEIFPWVGIVEADARSMESAGGRVYSLSGQKRFWTWLRWAVVAREHASQANESTTNESFERFVRDGVWGLDASWGTPGGNVRFYPDADAGDWVEYAVSLPREFRPEHWADGWAGGPWRCGFERLVYQTDSSLDGVTTITMPSLRAVGAVASGVGDVVPGVPTGLTTNDVELLFCECIQTETVAAPSGWTEIPDSPQTAAATKLHIFWRRWDGVAGDPTVVDPGNHVVAVRAAFQNVITTGNPYDVTAGDTGASSTSVSIPGDTTTTDNCLIVAACAAGTDIATPDFSSWTNSDLSSVTEIIDEFRTDAGGGGIGVATGGKATAGAYGATTATLGTASSQGRISIALKGAVS